MRLYESTFILSPQADDAAFDRQIKAITDLIEQNNGKTVREDRWGVRRMAYPIKKFTQGFYTRLVFEGNNQVLTELERFFKLEEPYIRYLTVLFEGSLEDKPFEGHVSHDSDMARTPNFSDVDDDDSSGYGKNRHRGYHSSRGDSHYKSSEITKTDSPETDDKSDNTDN